MEKLKSEASVDDAEEIFVVYQALYGDREIFVRPYDMFFEDVDKNILKLFKRNVLRKPPNSLRKKFLKPVIQGL